MLELLQACQEIELRAADSLISVAAHGQDFPHGTEDQLGLWPQARQCPLAKVLEKLGSLPSPGHPKAGPEVLEGVDSTHLTAASLPCGAQAPSLITAHNFLCWRQEESIGRVGGNGQLARESRWVEWAGKSEVGGWVGTGWGGAQPGRFCQDMVTILTGRPALPARLDGVAFISRGTAVGDDTVTPQPEHALSYP